MACFFVGAFSGLIASQANVVANQCLDSPLRNLHFSMSLFCLNMSSGRFIWGSLSLLIKSSKIYIILCHCPSFILPNYRPSPFGFTLGVDLICFGGVMGGLPPIVVKATVPLRPSPARYVFYHIVIL